MTNPQPEEQGETAPIELPSHRPPPSPLAAPPPVAEPAPTTESPRVVLDDATPVAEPGHPPAPPQTEVTFVPLAVTVGDGFKFGCGFFLAMVLAALVAFVLLALLFVLTGLMGLNLPLSR